MSRNTSIELGDEIVTFIDVQVSSGRYGSASEVIRAGLRMLQEREVELAILRSALIEGENSGNPVSFDVDSFIAGQKRH